MKNIPDRLTPEEAWSRLSSIPALETQNRSLESAQGHSLAREFLVPEDVPSGDRSFMDGYAVNHEDLAEAPARLKIAGEILMGAVTAQRLNRGESMFIPTGGFLPSGASAVVMQEDTTREGDFVIVQKRVTRDENVQKRAEDFQKGDILFASNHRLRSQDLATLATFGVTEVPVFRRPNITILSTGNELVPFRTRPAPGQIRETNALALSTAARQFGFAAETPGIIADRVADQTEAMQKALAVADVVLVSGGSSVGERDFTIDVIRSFPNSKVIFHGLAIRPGNPTIFATIDSHAVFGLPGQPVSSMIVFYQFVLPLLFHLSGEKVDYPQFPNRTLPSVTATLEQDLQPLKLKTDYVRLKLQWKGHQWIASPVLGKSASLSTLARADAFTIVPAGVKPIPAGTEIHAFLFS